MGLCSSGAAVGAAYALEETADGGRAASWVARPKRGARRRSGGFSEAAFRWTAVLGRGVAAEVWLAQLKASSEFYAVKCVRKADLERKGAGAVAALRTEAAALRAVGANSPLVPRLFGHFQDASRVWLVTEYAAGGELFRRLDDAGRMPEAHARFYAAELACAIEATHAAGFAHRDVKPENVMLDDGGHVKLGDFGLARAVDSRAPTAIPAAERCGTSMYVAPEMVRGKKEPHGVAVDWWALGCILFQMVAGRPPFGDSGDRTKFELYNRIAAGKPAALPRGLSAPLKAVLRGLLEPAPARRLDFRQLQAHEWFAGVPWGAVAAGRLAAPWVPALGGGPGSHEYFPKWEPLGAAERPGRRVSVRLD